MDGLFKELSRKRLMNVDGSEFVPKPAIDEIVDKAAISRITKATSLPIDEEDRPFATSLQGGLVHKIYATAKITFAISCYIKPHCLRHIVRLIRHGDNTGSKIDHRLPLSEDRLRKCGFESHDANAFLKTQMHFIAPKIQLGIIAPSEFRPDLILPLLAVEADDSYLLDTGAFGKVTKVRVASGYQVAPIHHGPLLRKQFKPEQNRKAYVEKEFLNELRNLAIISSARHDNIVQLLSAYVQGESFNFIFPLASHGNLSQLFGRNASSPWTSLEVVMALSGLVSALVTMHQFTTEDLQLIGCHRDLKPANILVDQKRLLLADFGLSRFVDSRERSTATAPDLNDDFIAPEHESKDFSLNRIGRSSDIWAFGCITLMVLVYHLEGKKGVDELKSQRRTEPWPKYAHHYFHNYDKPNSGLEELFKRLASISSPVTQGLLYLVKQMLVLQKDKRPRAPEIDAHMRSLVIHLQSTTIKGEFDKACRGEIVPVKHEMARFKGWHAALIKQPMTKINEYDFPEFRGSYASASYSDFKNVVEHLQQLQRTLVGFHDGDLGKGRKTLLPVSSRIDRLWGTLDENDSRNALAYTEDIMLKTNRSEVLHKTEKFLEQTSHKRTEGKAMVKRQILQPSSSSSLYVGFSCLKPKPLRDKVIRSRIVTGAGPESDWTIAEETKSLRWFQEDVARSVYEEQRSSRLQELANLLTRSAGKEFLRVLRCRGYYCSYSERRSGLLYELPTSKNCRLEKILTLHEILGRHKSGSTGWFLGDRFRLAHSLANAVYELHTVSWLHRNLTASNIIFFFEKDGDPIDPLSFYLIGFAQSRADEDLTYTDGPTSTGDTDEYYEHPKHLSESEGYQMQYDYYALGMLLLEIGFWKLVPDTVPNWSAVLDKRKTVMENVVPQLGASMGTSYHNAVLACLDGKWGEWAMQRRQEIPMLFRADVVERLGPSHCRA